VVVGNSLPSLHISSEIVFVRMSYSSNRTMVAHRSLGSGSFNDDGEICWSVEKAPQRQLLPSLPENSKLDHLAALSGLEVDEANLSWKVKDDADRRDSLTPTSSSSVTPSICSTDDDTASEQSCGEFRLQQQQQQCDVPVPMTDVDIYGQRHPLESPALIESKLDAFEYELEHFPPCKVENVVAAEELCPELVSSAFKLMFLRCECFDSKVCSTGWYIDA
jgi:hypothetical protein